MPLQYHKIFVFVGLKWHLLICFDIDTLTTLFWKRELMCERRKIMQNLNVDWITTKELAEIKGISERAVRKSIAKNKYVIRKSSKSYEKP